MKKSVFVGFSLLLLFATLVAGDLAESASVEVRDSSAWDTISESATFVNQDPDPAEPGGYVDVRFKVENIGTEKASDMVFELLPEFPFSLDPGRSAIRKLGDIYSRQVGENAYILHYRLRVDNEAVEGDNDLRFRYSLDSGTQWRLLEPFAVRIRSHDSILSVESVSATPETVPPGGSVDLRIKLRNIADSLLKNIKVTLDVRKAVQTATAFSVNELPFSPVGSTNEKTLLRLDSNQMANIDFNLVVDPDSTAGIYKIPLLISYSDELGTNFTKDNVISIRVGEEPDYVVSVDSSTLYTEDTQGTVSVRFVNKGSSDLKFVYMKLKETDDYEILSPEGVYLGNIDSDDYETADFDLYLKEEEDGQVILPITVEFRDAHNSMFSDRFDLELKLYSDSEAKKLGFEEKSNTLGIVIVVVIVVGGLVAYRFWRKRKKK